MIRLWFFGFLCQLMIFQIKVAMILHQQGDKYSAAIAFKVLVLSFLLPSSYLRAFLNGFALHGLWVWLGRREALKTWDSGSSTAYEGPQS